MNDRSSTGTAPPLRARLKALAAQAILDAAEEVFAEQGFQAGMDAIAARAGVAVGTLYNHFGDRDGLVKALFEARGQELLDAIDAAAQAHGDRPFEEQLTATLAAAANCTERHAAFRRLAFQTEIQGRQAARREFGRTLVERLGQLLARGRGEGRIAEDPDGLQPVLLLGLLHTAVVLYLEAPERLPAGRIAEVVARQFLDGARGPR